MNKKYQIAFTIGIMCILLSAAIVIQLNTIKEATKIVGTSYARASLKDEVLSWKEKSESQYKVLEAVETELEKTRQEATKENSRGTELEEELSKANRFLGLTELTGSGVIVTLADNNEIKASEIEGDDNINYYLIHDVDLWSVINELYNAGAEAISVNGQRIVGTTAITCSGAVITVNGVKMSSPFKISAIGNPETLYGVARPGGYLENIATTGSVATIEKSNNVTVAKYTGTLTSKYMNSAE